MKLVIEHLESRLFLAEDGRWVALPEEAKVFAAPASAIAFCIARGVRDIRLVTPTWMAGRTVQHYYPFGNDPALKQERRKLRRALAERRRAKRDLRRLSEFLNCVPGEQPENRKSSSPVPKPEPVMKLR